jgi:S-adenosylmethionine:tRNA ribosyltransferase-isomerase
MTTVADRPVVTFRLDAAHEAHEPPEARGVRRDRVRLLVSRGDDEPVDATFADLGSFLDAGDAIAVNVSATIPAALDGRLPDGEPVIVHLSGSLPGEVWLVEVRTPSEGASIPRSLPDAVDVALLDGGHVQLLTPFADSQRMWIARLALMPSPLGYASRHGRPIRYRHVTTDWPISAYQTVFARRPGSAEMPSASRPFTPELVTELVAQGVLIVPLVLHAGVSSLEGDERPYPERYRVPDATAVVLNGVRRNGGRIVAAGTTVVRALATVTDDHGVVHPGRGWTDVVVTAGAPVSSVDGLLTGWHEPESSHLQMLAAFLNRDALNRAYAAALDRGYLWHEFGDSHLLLRAAPSRP